MTRDVVIAVGLSAWVLVSLFVFALLVAASRADDAIERDARETVNRNGGRR